MPRTEEANEQIRRESSAKIIEAARAVYARKGSAATVAEIAEEAGVSQGLPYRYFRTKKGLINAMIEGVLRTGSTGTLPAAPMSGTPGHRFERIVTNMVDLRRLSPELFQLLQQGNGRSAIRPKLRRALMEHGLSVRARFRQLIVEGQATGEIVDGDPDELVIALLACLDGLSRIGWASSPSGKVAFPDAKIILRMFLAPRSPP